MGDLSVQIRSMHEPAWFPTSPIGGAPDGPVRRTAAPSLWSQLVSQLVCREDVRVAGSGDGATGYVDRKPGRFDAPTGRIALTTDGEEGQILLLPDRVEVNWQPGPSGSVPLNLSNTYRTGSIKNTEEDSSAYPRSAHSYSSAREAAEALLPRLFLTHE